MARRLALLIGNAEFEELDNFPNLPTPANDVNDFAQLLMEQGEFEIVEQLIDKDTDVLRKSIENFYRGTKSGDLTLFYYSGHGFRNEDGALCLVACDTQLNHPLSTSIQESFIRDAMRFGRSQHRVIILDCCFSGTFNVGSKTGVETLLFDKLQGETTAILSSSSRVQLSFIEKGRNSLFTKYLLEGIRTERADSNRDGQITINELFAYSESRVRASRPEQTPTLKLHERMDQVIIAKTTLSNEASASSLQPVHELLEKALAIPSLLNTHELDQVSAESKNPQLKFTKDEQKLILLSSMAQERGMPAWLHLNESDLLMLLRMARLDSAYDVTLRLKVTGQLGRLEDEETFSALQQEAVTGTKAKQKETTSGLAHFVYHSQQKRPLPLHLSLPVEIKMAALRRRDYRGYITTLSAAAGRYAGFGALVTGAIMGFRIITGNVMDSPFMNFISALGVLLLFFAFSFLITRYWVFALASTQVSLLRRHWILKTAVLSALGLLGLIVFIPLTTGNYGWIPGVILAVILAFLNSLTYKQNITVLRLLPIGVGIITFISSFVFLILSGLPEEASVEQFDKSLGLLVTSLFCAFLISKGIAAWTDQSSSN